MPFQFERLHPLPDVVLVKPRVFGDERGWFMETYKRSDFEAAGIREDFRQDNQSRSTQKGVVRGLHYQKDPAAQGKLVRALVGEILDVAVDIRKGSPTYGRWASATLTEANRHMLYVPPGFAHGFCTLTSVTEVHYKTTAEYRPDLDRAIRWNDPTLHIAWPVAKPILSPKDENAPLLADADNGFTWEERK